MVAAIGQTAERPSGPLAPIAPLTPWHPVVVGALNSRSGAIQAMRSVQATPQFSPFYIEFEEYLGGYNFGGGNAQLDLQQMQFDWACG